MRVDDFDFHLPEASIALRPVHPRTSAKMLIVNPEKSTLKDESVTDILNHVRAGDCLVLNDTRVFPARLYGKIATEGRTATVEVLLHGRIPEQGLMVWRTYIKGRKKVRQGDTLIFGEDDYTLTAVVTEKKEHGDDVVLTFQGDEQSFWQNVERCGVLPLPPYIAKKRGVDEKDAIDYQTVVARHKGSVAAPTAALHFDAQLLEEIKSKGVTVCVLTLHVGAGTFQPVKVQDTKDHIMHAEWACLPADVCETLNNCKKQGGRVIAVGTTTFRTLETACDDKGVLHPFTGETDIFITESHQIRFTDILMTNFHLPKSTLFMLVCAFCGKERMKNAYDYAIEKDYRFYSYGDSSLLYRAKINSNHSYKGEEV